MDVHVRVDLEPSGPVVVKSGSGPAARRLRRERDRLARAVHPGVVALAGAHGDDAGVDAAEGDGDDPGAHAGADAAGDGCGDDAVELRTCYAGEPVARWGGSVAAVAGLGAAVASTLADLHEMGLVHGRLDSSHVLVADDGRPRLCGLAGAEGAVASDDVEALGALLGELLARCPARPRRRSAWRRRPDTAWRALEQVIEQATDPVATRRPTARALAEAILTAVPDAGLPDTVRPYAGLPAVSLPAASLPDTGLPDAGFPGTGRPHAGLPAAEVPRAAGAVVTDGDRKASDTLDRIWSYADTRSDEERWAEALGTGPSDLPAAARDDPPLPIADGDTPPWGADIGAHDPGGPGLPRRGQDGGAGDVHDGDMPPWGAGTGHGDELPWATGGPDPAADRTAPLAVDADLTRDHVAASRRVAAVRRPAGERASLESSARRRIGLAAAGAAAVGVAMAGAALIGPGGGADAPRTGPPPRPAAAAGDCAAVAAPAADVDGDGCPDALSVHDRTVDAGVARWSLGDPGDHVALGDWDCNGEAGAALLRPGTGEVFVFAAWAETGEDLTVDASDRVDGAVGIRAEPDGVGCDDLVVDLGTGGAITVEVAP